MSDWKVEMANDSMAEFFVEFHGPKESACPGALVPPVARGAKETGWAALTPAAAARRHRLARRRLASKRARRSLCRRRERWRSC
jgi:hypothetical protein